MLLKGMEPHRLTPAQTAQILNVSTRTLRRWSVAFADSLSKSAGRKGKRRTYDGQDVETLRRAGQLMSDGLTTKEVAEVLPIRDPDEPETTALVLSPEAQMTIVTIAENAAIALERLEHVADEMTDLSARVRQLEEWLALPWWKRIGKSPP